MGNKHRTKPHPLARSSTPRALHPSVAASLWLERQGIPRNGRDPRALDAAHRADPELVASLDAADALAKTADDFPSDRAPQVLRDAFAASRAAYYSTLERSRLLHGSRDDAATTHGWLAWWAAAAPPAQRILDIGAGSGLIAAGYAALRPEIETVIAADPLPQAAVSAAQWSLHAAVSDRVRPVTVAADALEPGLIGGAVDQVTCVRTLANFAESVLGDEAANGVYDTETELAQLLAGPANELDPIVAGIARVMKPDAVLLLHERVLGMETAALYVAVLQRNGFGVDLSRSRFCAVTDATKQTLSYVTITATAGAPAVNGDELCAWALRHDDTALPTPTVAWKQRLRYDDPELWLVMRYPPSSGGGVHRVEVLFNTGVTLRWDTTSKRYRELRRLPSSRSLLSHCLELCQWADTGVREHGCTLVELDGPLVGLVEMFRD